MAHIDMKRSHTLGKDGAKKVAEELAEDLKSKIDAKYHWDGDDLKFERSGAKGLIHVTDGEVQVQVELGLMLRPMRGMIEGKIKSYMDEKLS
jgi:putative polyhydroxyalkanoate system protein